MSTTRKLWVALGALLAVSFAALLWVGSEIHRVMPPIPEQVVTTSGVGRRASCLVPIGTSRLDGIPNASFRNGPAGGAAEPAP